MNLNPIICERRFFLWKLEYWWVFIDKPQYRPKGRTKIKGNWYWRDEQYNELLNQPEQEEEQPQTIKERALELYPIEDFPFKEDEERINQLRKAYIKGATEGSEGLSPSSSQNKEDE